MHFTGAHYLLPLTKGMKRIYNKHLVGSGEKLDFSLVGIVPSVPFYKPRRDIVSLNGKKILALGGDLGGFNNIVPVLAKAADKGASVQLLLSAGSARQFEQGKLKLDPRFRVYSDVKDREAIVTPDAIIVGASQTDEGTENALTGITHHHIPGQRVLLVQDMYGSAHPLLRELVKYTNMAGLRRVCTHDAFAARMMANEFPQLADKKGVKISVTGGPQFDSLLRSGEELHKRRQEVRQQLSPTDRNRKIEEKDLVVLVVGGVSGCAEILCIVHLALQQLGLTNKSFVIVREHETRATPEDRHMTAAMKASMHDIAFTDVLGMPIEDLLPAADIVISGFSTVNYKAILQNKPGVIYAGTPANRIELMKEKGLNVPPEVEAQAGQYVENARDLAFAINRVRDGFASMKHIVNGQWPMIQSNDGRATDRVFEELLVLLQS
jgi:hypothetical protein